MDIARWLAGYCAAVRAAFGERIVFIGLQGSFGRGEATEGSDIDVVLILDRLSPEDLAAYREAAASLPERGRLCGFVCGKAELMAWERSDLLSVWLDSVPVEGSLAFLAPLFSKDDIRRAVLIGACGVYHACAHNYLHRRSEKALAALRKSAFFTMRAARYYDSGEYIPSRAALLPLLTAGERAVFEGAELDAASAKLFAWAGETIKKYGEK